MLRRSFLARFSSVAAVVGFGHQAPPVQAPSAAPPATRPASTFQPTRHEKDDWFDELPGQHRILLDSFMAPRFPEVVQFAGNTFSANKSDYGLTEKDLAVIMVVRHQTAPFAFNDAMWAKYGKAFSTRMEWVDPKTKEAPTTNLYNRQLTNLIKQGMQLAVCSLTTRAYTRILAQQTGQTAEDLWKELTSNTLGNAHFVPAGVVAVTRGQERGYRLVSVGG